MTDNNQYLTRIAELEALLEQEKKKVEELSNEVVELKQQNENLYWSMIEIREVQ